MVKRIYILVLVSIIASGGVFFIFVNPPALLLIKQLPHYMNKQTETQRIVYTKLPDISIYVQQAAIVSQDRRFYSNVGIDLRGTVRAILFSILNRRRQGASTITEQFAKNIYFNDRDSLKTDIATKILALYLTHFYPKQKILEMYLNIIYFGNDAYGIGQASDIYFHTDPKTLTVSESAYLIGLINKPSYLSNHHTEALTEAKIIIGQMLSQNDITKLQYSLASAELAKM